MKRQSVILFLIFFAKGYAKAGLGSPRSEHEETLSPEALNSTILEREPIDRQDLLDEASTNGHKLELAHDIDVLSPEREYGFEREPIDEEIVLRRSYSSLNTSRIERMRESNVDDVKDENELGNETAQKTMDVPVAKIEAVARLRRRNEPAVEGRLDLPSKESLRDLTTPLVSQYRM